MLHSKYFDMDFDEILAKSEPRKTLIQHTTESLFWFEKVLQWNAQLIDKILLRYKIDKNILIQRLFLTVAFHDIGKATEKFQLKLRRLPFMGKESHSLSSIPFIYQIIEKNPLLNFNGIAYYPEVLAIVSHHSKLRKELFDGYENMKTNYLSEDFFKTFYQIVNEQAMKLKIPSWENATFSGDTLKINPYHLFKYKLIPGLEENELIYAPKYIVRDVFVLFKSVLHYCDWLASSCEFDYQYYTNENKESITQRMKEKVPSFESWRNFQIESAESGAKNLFVQIPTGQGKTEASVLWSVESNENQKILFLLPTMVTTNKMWERMRFFFDGDSAVGLSHGNTQYILKKDDEIEPESLRKHYLYNRTFLKPVTVATIDQLIYSFFNWGHWVLTANASFNAKIVIDEVHIYDAYTFGLILQIIKYLSSCHTKFAIMSASLPNVLKEELEKVLPEYNLIKDDCFNEKQRHVLQISDKNIENHIYEIISDYKGNKKVLVICNTIKKAREIYDALKEENISICNMLLYHSQFILKDKKDKEEILEKIINVPNGFIAICTQIVEVSLDIDFDVLYTENAPIDAIIQRLGRVNRKGEIQKRASDMLYAKVVIAKESGESKKYVYKDLSTILEETYKQLSLSCKELNGNLKEKDFKVIVDEVYTKSNLGENYYKEMEEARELIDMLWKNYLNHIYTLSAEEREMQKISSRKNNYITGEAVLIRHYQKYNFDNPMTQEDFDLIREHTLKVPMHLIRKYSSRKLNNADVYLLDMKYNEQEGLSLEPDDSNFM
jgi:CRISPR-associated endonuclease/helicase Cas3